MGVRSHNGVDFLKELVCKKRFFFWVGIKKGGLVLLFWNSLWPLHANNTENLWIKTLHVP